MRDQNQYKEDASDRAFAFRPRYSRLFGEKFRSHDRNKLIALADRMKAPPRTATDLNTISSTMVYFGQFIDHDITRDKTMLDAIPYPEPRETKNERNPRLDLDSLYADGPGGKKCESPEEIGCAVYDLSTAGAEKFVTRRVGKGFDIPRDKKANPWIGDPRNDENLIISQLHVLFMRFHNRVVDLLKDPRLSFPAPGIGTIFDRAKRFVTWHYQWLVREEFLKAILHRNVFTDMAAPGYKPQLFKVAPGTLVDLPVEFTMAAYRFGHSMVRDIYRLNNGRPLELMEILNLVARPLDPAHVIDWSTFATNDGQAIDRTIALGLYGLSNRIISLFRGPGKAASHLALPARTLIRGSNVGLPSGQEACKRAGIPIIAFSKTDRHYKDLRDLKMLYNTPLWYYVLYEAEMTGTDSAGSGSLTLGPLGSRIVGEVFLAILMSDKNSYVHHYWEPPAFSVKPSAPKQMINSLQRLIAFATGN